MSKTKSKSYHQRAAKLTDAEWKYIVSILMFEFECNENKTAVSALKKISGVSSSGGDKMIPSAVRWFAADDKKRNARRGTLGKMMKKAGFEIQHTGGGIYLWNKDMKDDWSMMISGADDDLGRNPDEAFGLGVYNGDFNQVGWLQCDNLKDALAAAKECERDAKAFAEKYPFD